MNVFLVVTLEDTEQLDIYTLAKYQLSPPKKLPLLVVNAICFLDSHKYFLVYIQG